MGKKQHILKKKTKPHKQTKKPKQTTKLRIFVRQKYFFPHITTNKKCGATLVPLWTLSWWDSPHFFFSGKDPVIPSHLETSRSRLCTGSIYIKSPAGFGIDTFLIKDCNPRLVQVIRLVKDYQILTKETNTKTELKKKGFNTEKKICDEVQFTQAFYVGHSYPIPFEVGQLFSPLLFTSSHLPFWNPAQGHCYCLCLLSLVKPLLQSIRGAYRSRWLYIVWYPLKHQPGGVILPANTVLPPSHSWLFFISKLSTPYAPWWNRCSS